jgi:hypothetical protein
LRRIIKLKGLLWALLRNALELLNQVNIEGLSLSRLESLDVDPYLRISVPKLILIDYLISFKGLEEVEVHDVARGSSEDHNNETNA